MLTRLHKAVEENDEGFTLIELLVVMIIIGILAAIAIPVFLNQRKKAVDSSMKSDLRTVANAMETYFTDKQTYTLPAAVTGATGTATIGGDSVTLSNGNSVTVTTGANSYCVSVTRVSGASASSNDWYYASNAGGIQPSSVTACPALT